MSFSTNRKFWQIFFKILWFVSLRWGNSSQKPVKILTFLKKRYLF